MHMFARATLLLLLGSAPCGCSSLDDAKNRPVSKVVTLLKDMLAQLEKEAEEDEEIYDKMACWCETNDKEKTKAIADAEAKIKDLNNRIEEYTALSARLLSETNQLKKEVEENQASLDKATKLREKELAEFTANEKDLLESISALKAAIQVLSKHNGGASMLQIPRTHMLGIAATLQHEMQRHGDLLKGALSHADRRLVNSFIQAPDDYFGASPTFKQSYAPQSGEIFGVLTQMQETFENNLAAEQKEELANQKAYEELKAAKEQEIAAAKEQIASKTEERATIDEKNANAKEDLEDTRSTLSADEQFLLILKEKCSMTDKEMEERQKTRHLEMQACSKALAVLSADDAHDTFSRTFNFLQTSTTENTLRQKASEVLMTASKKLQNPHLSTLATQVRLDAFTRVIKAIDDMIAQLLKEKEDEIKHKDFCTDELNQNAYQTEEKEREKQDLADKIADLELTIKTLTEEINNLKAQIAEMQVQMKRAGEDREKENREFQLTVADQRSTQKLLQSALAILEQFYGKAKAEGSLLQRQEPAGPPPPPGFQTYRKNEASGGVMGMIQQIMNDAKAMEAEAIKSEEDAQKAYEAFVTETNASIEAASNSIANKSEERANTEAELVETKESKEAVELELEHLSNYNAELHTACDFVLKNFEVRQTARDEEVEALKQAKAILRGAKFEDFLQKA